MSNPRTTNEPPLLLTVGHSTHPIERFADLVTRHDVEVLVDVRSQPYSRFAPQFNREALKEAMTALSVRYVFLGRELGGRPDGGEYYDDDGHVLYGRVAASSLFNEGLDRLAAGMKSHRLAIMCSEEDPTACHRRLLVARVLRDRGAQILHLRGDGRTQDDSDLGGGTQGDLFSGFEESAWRSTRSVSPRKAPLNSSAS